LPDLSEVAVEALGGEILPRSVLLCLIEGLPYLMCALGDGHLVTFHLEPETGAVSNRKKVSLGTQPILLNTFQSKNTCNVFAASDRPTVVYSHNKKLLYSNVNIKEATCMCSFNSASFPESLAIASDDGMMIGTIDDIQKLHIHSVPLGEQPRRICHMDSARAFGVCTSRRVEDDNDLIENFFFKLIDDQTFEVLHDYPMQENEWSMCCEAVRLENDEKEYFVVGTAVNQPEEHEPTEGRILVLSVSEGKLDLVSECRTKGAVYDLEKFNGRILAGVNSRLWLYEWAALEDGIWGLQPVCSRHGHIVALMVKARGDFIAVGDIMKSVSLLTFKEEDKTIEEIAKDCNSNWMTALAILDDDTFLAADNCCNLFTLKKNADAPNDEDRSRLEVVGEYHVGESINTIQHGSLVMKVAEGDVATKYPTVLYGTVSGMVGVLAQLSQEQYTFLSKVQGAMSKVVKGVGGLEHSEWRSFHNSRKTSKARNFIDGDLVESFLQLSKDDMDRVVEAVGGTTLEEITKIVEEMTQLH